VNQKAGFLTENVAVAIVEACDDLIGREEISRFFPLPCIQGGAGTSTNMNVNEVVANLALEKLGEPKGNYKIVHPNDHVNLGQSSNDVIPATIHLSACVEVHAQLLPSLSHLAKTLDGRIKEIGHIVKTGRTHLMDAMPLTLGQEMSGWAAQIRSAQKRIEDALERLACLALGGTAVGTGTNAHPRFAEKVVERLRKKTGIDLHVADNYFEAMSSQDASVEMSGQLRGLAVSVTKIANDLRWMNSGPLAGLGEIALPALQPGSSIMPGKVNPVIPEAAAMACAQVMGNDATIALAGQSGNFQLNVMLPLIAYNLLQSISLMANVTRLLADKAISGFEVNEARIEKALSRNPIVVTALNPIVGYEIGAKIAKTAYAENRPVLDVAAELTDISREELARLLDPKKLTRGGITPDPS
ncbi:MAG: class II fumarate hydratase, partial [Planctomycetota bacterium]